MAEWSNAAVLKTVVRQRTGGSNPSFSAKEIKGLVLERESGFFCCISTSSELPNYKKALDITPLRSTPGMEESEYTKNELVIYQDYLIRIYTEEFSEGDTSRYENFYRINDQGEFYEVKK